jgi:DNA (cytosine-5)-methyltransferase 1
MTNNKHKFPYKWNLADGYPAKGIAKNECNVFGTFICGGGSTMGYKLAGFNHLGGVEIDVKVADAYKENHKPKYLFVEDIRAFNKRTDLPTELFNLDILDGSPPCSTFSMAGSREKAWGKSKQFREGQAMQTLDDLVFVYCDTIIKLQPKVFLLENVKGIIQGNAKAYSKAIVKKMQEAGYTVQVFCLNAASMGVPQKRERVFFIGHKKEYNLPKLKLEFNEVAITFGEVKIKNCKSPECFNFPPSERERLALVEHGDRNLVNADKKIRGNDKNAFFNQNLVYDNGIMGTITGQEKSFVFSEKRRLSFNEVKLCGTYPLDYNFKTLEPKYLIGMSVPPVMTAQISHQIYLQWLSKIKQ